VPPADDVETLIIFYYTKFNDKTKKMKNNRHGQAFHKKDNLAHIDEYLEVVAVWDLRVA
jgi:hypothetical protein